MPLTLFLLTLAVLGLLITLWVAFYRLQDLNKRLGPTNDIGGGDASLVTLDELSRQKAMIQQEIKEIELDFEMGKIDLDDFKRLKRRFESAWLDVDDKLQALLGETKVQRSAIDMELQRRIQLNENTTSASERAPRLLCPTCGAIQSGPMCPTCGLSHPHTT